MKTRRTWLKWGMLGMLMAAAAGSRAQDTLDIDKTADASRLVPISVAGYSGEVDKVLRFDLEVAGFRLVSAETAQYNLSGKNNGDVEARLIDRISKASLLGKQYSGGSPRTQAHALADDVVMAIHKTPGIARTKIAFKGESGAHNEIFISDYDGFNPVALTKDNSICAAPTWVPGRRMVLYTSYRGGYPDIYSHDLASGERRSVARYPGLNTSATVSPDGRRVAMILSKAGSPDLYVSDLDGGNLVQLTKTREDESSPCWSPDGSTICFVGRVNERRALYTVPSTGGAMTRLRTDGTLNPTEPDWSPDGKTIVFTSQMGGFSICTIPSKGGTAEVLVAGEDPSWAPNSRTVVFTKRVRNKRILSLLDVPSKRVKDIAINLGNCSQPSWAK